MSNLFAWLIVLMDLVICEYNQYGEFRERNRRWVGDKIQSFVGFELDEYYIRPFTQTLGTAWSLWLEIGERNFHMFETALIYSAVITAFFHAAIRVFVLKTSGKEESPPLLEGFSRLGLLPPGKEENPAGTQPIPVGGFVPFGLLSPTSTPTQVPVEVKEVMAEKHEETVIQELKRQYKTLAKAKKALGSKASSWKKLAAEELTRNAHG